MSRFSCNRDRVLSEGRAPFWGGLARVRSAHVGRPSKGHWRGTQSESGGPFLAGPASHLVVLTKPG